MDEERMKKRGVNFFNKFHGKLVGFKLVFQEFLKDKNKGSYANIVPDKDSFVEGVVYEVDESIAQLDGYENIPTNYNKEEVLISTDKGDILCLVYIGNKKNIGIQKSPKKEYLGHLLEGKSLLSEEYFDMLSKIKVIE